MWPRQRQCEHNKVSIHTNGGTTHDTCVLTVYMAGGGERSEVNESFELSLVVLPCAFWIGAVVELVGRGHTGMQLIIEIAKVTGARIASLPVAGFIILSLFFPTG